VPRTRLRSFTYCPSWKNSIAPRAGASAAGADRRRRRTRPTAARARARARARGWVYWR
jgi:hypothetical protein